MPQRHHPIPRFDGQISSQQQLDHLLTQQTRNDREVLPPRHRAGSLHTQSGHGRDRSPSIAPLATSNTTNSSTMPSNGGGERRSSGRALPPPRFQRKQRPPRVQQALAASNPPNQSGSSNSHGRSRRGTNADPNVSGTLTLGPANNWGAGTTSVASLSMATINAASARGSVIRRQQQDRPIPSTIHPATQLAPPPTLPELEVGDMLEEDASFGPDMDFRGMDPVQLHNRLTFGMGRPNHSDSFSSDHPHGFNTLEPEILEPYESSYLPSYASPSTGATFSLGVTNPGGRQRSRSQNQPTSSLYSQVPHLTSPYGHIADSPSASQSSFSSISLQQPSFDPEAQPRFGGRPIMAPVDMVDPSMQPPAFATGALPPLPGRVRLQPSNALSASSSTPHLTLDTRRFGEDVTYTVQSGTSNLVAPSPTAKRPLKSALKVRKSAPELVDTSLANTFDSANYPPFELPHVPARLQAQPPFPHQAALHRHPSSAVPHEPAGFPPDAHFTLPDSLQAQYAYQLRLLQQEYADKAARAEAMRSGGDRPTRPTGVTPSNHVGGGFGMGDVTRQYAGMMLAGQGETMDVTPPSSGGGSMSGYRVSFQEDVGVIGTSTGSDYTPGYEEAHEDDIEYVEGGGEEGAEGYASWDEEWEEQEAEGIVGEEEAYGPAIAEGDEEEFNYEFGDGFGSLEPTGQSQSKVSAPPATIDPRQPPKATPSSISSKASEDDERSDVGDRGHEDRGLEFSPTDPLISPTRAVFHGHGVEESPSISSAANSSDILGRSREAEQEDEAKAASNAEQRRVDERLLIPQVEVIAPTPTLPILELGGAFEPQVLKPMEGVDDKVEEKAPRSSEDSAGHKNSSEEGSSGSTESNATIQRQIAGAQVSATQQLPTIHSATTTPTLPSERPVPAPVSTTVRPITTSQTSSLPTVDLVQPEVPQFPPSLQRLAQRLSRGGSIPMPPVSVHSAAPHVSPLLASQSQALMPAPHLLPPPMLPPVMSQPNVPDSVIRGSVRHPALNPHTSTFVPAAQPLTAGASAPYGRVAGSQESHRSDSGRRRSMQQPLARQAFPSQQELNPIGAPNYAMQQELRRRNPSLRSLALSEDINTQLPHPHSAFSHTSSARPRHSSLVFADMSSAASIESGSSHGGGTSGGSHAHPFGRPRTSSSHQPNIGGSFGNNTRISPSNAPLSPLSASRLQGNAYGAGGSSEGWDEDRLFSVKSNDSLRAASITSGRSAGSTGSGKGNRMGLGGESIWTLKEDEGMAWGSEAPSSSGHSITGTRNPNQWTLQSLVSDTASQTHSSDGRSHFEESLFPEEIPGYRGIARHPYQSLPPSQHNASVTSFQSSGPSFMDSPSLPSFKHQVPIQQPYGQSRSTPAFPVFTGSDHSHENVEAHYAPEDLDRLRAMRVAQARAQAAPSHPRPPPQNRSQPSLPSHSSINMANRYTYTEDIPPLSQPGSVSSSARGRISLPVLPGQPPFGNVVPLPATGGVFPRLQEIAGPNGDASRMIPGNNGRFKGLFKNRDSRVFK